MNRFYRFLFTGLVLFFYTGLNSHAQSLVSRMNPTHWWVGMENPDLQVLVYGPKIGLANWKLTSYRGVRLTRVEHVSNPNYVFLHLQISDKAKPGDLELVYSLNGQAQIQKFALKARSGYQPQGLSPADVVYLLMPDRFANGDPSNDAFADMADPIVDRKNPFARHGGDLQGIQKNLPYFKELGVTALWLNPVIENDQAQTNEGGTLRSAYHGYGFTDHYAIDRRLGGNQAYKEMIRAAHQAGLKVIQDAVYNHAGINHWILQDLPFPEWLNQWPSFTQTSFKEPPVLDPHASEYDKKVMSNGWFMPFLPDLNQKDPRVARFLIQHALWTVEEFGIDAWRIDTYMYNDLDFMNACNAALKKQYPTLFLFGESLATPVPNLAYFVANRLQSDFSCNLESTVDYTLFQAIKSALNEPYSWHGGVNRLYGTLAQDFLFQNPELLVTYLDNHDEDRFFSVVGKDPAKYKMGLGWLFTLRGIPQIYYGTELGVKNFKDPSDAEVRKDFPGGWAEDNQNAFDANQRTTEQADWFAYVQKLTKLRTSTPALSIGKFTQFMPFQDGVYVYFRHTDGQRLMVLSNTGDRRQPIGLDRFQEILRGATQARNALTGELVNLTTLSLEPAQFLLLEIL